MTKKLSYVTSNIGKFQEVQQELILSAPEIELEHLCFEIQEIQSYDQLEITLDKAQKAWALIQKPLILDDAAIYFERYSKFPGTLSKYVSLGLGLEGIKRLFDEGDKAYFLLHMVYIDSPDSYQIFEGYCEGHLTKPKTLEGHPQLPYDAFFIPNNEKQTYAQIRGTPLAEKYLYRLQALKKFLAWYTKKR